MTPFIAIVVALVVIAVLTVAGRSSRDDRTVLFEIRAGRPRRARALLRLSRRAGSKDEWAWFYEATALFWQGRFERARELLAGRHASAPALALEIECLIFSDRVAEARKLFDESSAAMLAYAPAGYPEGVVLLALLEFHESNLESAGARLAQVARENLDGWSPFSRIVHFFTAAIDARRGRLEDARAHLDTLITSGADSFIESWAADAYEQCFGTRPIVWHEPPRRSAPRFIASVARSVSRGVRLLLFRRSAVEGPFTHGDVALVVVFDLVLSLSLQMSLGGRRAVFVSESLGQVLFPVLVVAPAIYFIAAALGARRLALDLAGFAYSALPLLIVVEFAANHATEGGQLLAAGFALGSATWLSAAILFATACRAPDASPARRVFAAALMCAAWFLPERASSEARLWWAVPSKETMSSSTLRDEVDVGMFMLDQGDKIHDVERALAPERPGVQDLYFVGFAAYDQDVFRHEVVNARELLDDRFDTRGRSLVMSNDPDTRDKLPMALRANLTHVLRFIGSAMNREEDVLFLFLTSHGSRSGLGIRAPHAPEALGEDQITPVKLRADLDAAGIKWRVIIASGCMAGGFVRALANDETIIATASAEDRYSSGCKTGNEFTDYGRAVFANALKHDCSFAAAFTKANAIVAEGEKARDAEASMPQLSIGAAIDAKLRSMTCKAP